MAIRVINAGALTTVQDAGRSGFLQYGVTGCGAMDRKAYEDANKLVGNEGSEAVIEMTLYGGIYEFTCDTSAAVTGADMGVETYRTLRVKAGERLVFGPAKDGCRTYLAVQGGIQVPLVMGSRSTDLKAKIGGLEGRKLRAGDVLETVEGLDAAAERSLARPEISQEFTLRVIAGPQDDRFTDKGLKIFYSSEFTVSNDSDRMGIRLSGPAIESAGTSDIVSDAIVFGSVQITSAGLPIVLMADRQTTGGYAKIATVCSFDLPKLAQARPGAKVRFKEISIGEAERCHTKR